MITEHEFIQYAKHGFELITADALAKHGCNVRSLCSARVDVTLDNGVLEYARVEFDGTYVRAVMRNGSWTLEPMLPNVCISSQEDIERWLSWLRKNRFDLRIERGSEAGLRFVENVG